ncbi:MAG: DNA polymerase III subunit delta' [Gammaproteobacteria bacterium]|nr:DNA polymerase III subunit delta' [Gammaproteobacteria bacterium]QOJ31566.1 MAG: DNA polymerase III subunit delta' [Gammaproteobacteria bacterium]
MDKHDLTGLPPWLLGPAASLEAGFSRQRNPQALLIHGTPGCGRRVLALWYAARLLGIPSDRLAGLLAMEADGETGPEPGHADFMFLRPPPDKSVIPVEAVRDLIGFLQLKSHQGGARVALIWPAESLTTAAANSLLKTLEEPPAGGHIVLVASTPAALPATVLSRCQRLAVHRPERSVAVDWLGGRAGGADWDLLLDVAAGAPLRALDLHGQGFSGQARQLNDDLRQLAAGRESPVSVAQRWAGFDTDLVPQWLYWKLAGAIRAAADGGVDPQATKAGSQPLQKPGKALNMQALLQRLAEVEELRRFGTKAVKADIQYAALLQRWFG